MAREAVMALPKGQYDMPKVALDAVQIPFLYIVQWVKRRGESSDLILCLARGGNGRFSVIGKLTLKNEISGGRKWRL